MIGVYVTFDYDGDFDHARVLKVAEGARGTFEGMPGLRVKLFTFDEKQQRVTNFYLWDSDEAAEAFFTDALRARVTDLYGVEPTIDFVEIAQIVDNSGSVGIRLATSRASGVLGGAAPARRPARLAASSPGAGARPGSRPRPWAGRAWP